MVDRTVESGFKLKEVSADKGYLGADNMLATARRYPIHPVQADYHFYSLHRAEFLQHYHKRSNVETTFHMIKVRSTLAESHTHSTD